MGCLSILHGNTILEICVSSLTVCQTNRGYMEHGGTKLSANIANGLESGAKQIPGGAGPESTLTAIEED